jgi:hypothetical protein
MCARYPITTSTEAMCRLFRFPNATPSLRPRGPRRSQQRQFLPIVAGRSSGYACSCDTAVLDPRGTPRRCAVCRGFRQGGAPVPLGRPTGTGEAVARQAARSKQLTRKASDSLGASSTMKVPLWVKSSRISQARATSACPSIAVGP